MIARVLGFRLASSFKFPTNWFELPGKSASGNRLHSLDHDLSSSQMTFYHASRAALDSKVCILSDSAGRRVTTVMKLPMMKEQESVKSNTPWTKPTSLYEKTLKKSNRVENFHNATRLAGVPLTLRLC